MFVLLEMHVCSLSYFHCRHFQLTEPKEGLKDWLDAVTNARIPCAVVSNLDRKNMMNALERMGLQNYFQVSNKQLLENHLTFYQVNGLLISADTCLHPPFQAVVSEEDGMESIAHRFLSAAVKVLLIIQILILTNFSKKMLKSFKTLVRSWIENLPNVLCLRMIQGV